MFVYLFIYFCCAWIRGQTLASRRNLPNTDLSCHYGFSFSKRIIHLVHAVYTGHLRSGRENKFQPRQMEYHRWLSQRETWAILDDMVTARNRTKTVARGDEFGLLGRLSELSTIEMREGNSWLWDSVHRDEAYAPHWCHPCVLWPSELLRSLTTGVFADQGSHIQWSEV